MNTLSSHRAGWRSVALSVALHVMVIVLLAVLAQTEHREEFSLRLAASVQDEQATEMELSQPDIAVEPPLDQVEVTADVPVANYGQEPIHLPDLSSLLSGGAFESHSAADPNAAHNAMSAHRLFSAPITAAIDAARHHGGYQTGYGSERRTKIRKYVAYEIAQIHPGCIFAVVYFPMGVLEPNLHLPAPQERNRQQVMNWVTSQLESFADPLHSSSGPELMLIASTDPLPVEELRNIIARCCPYVPVRVLGLKLEREAASELKSLASVAGGTYFGVE